MYMKQHKFRNTVKAEGRYEYKTSEPFACQQKGIPLYTAETEKMIKFRNKRQERR
jgi:hypothetical protein